MSLFNNKYVKVVKKTVDSFRPKAKVDEDKSAYDTMQDHIDTYKKRLKRSRNIEDRRKDMRRRWHNDG